MIKESWFTFFDFSIANANLLFTCVSYAEARKHIRAYELDVRPSVRHTLVLYQNG